MALSVGQLERQGFGIWEPQPGKQALAIAAPFVTELMYGGARGGGKSDFLLGDFAQDADTYGVNWRGVLFRKSYPELEELIARAKEIYGPMGAVWRASEKMFIFPSGSTLKMRHLDTEDDCANYQGHQYTWIGWDELTNWPNLNAYKKLKACLRNGNVPVENKRIRCSANPGGVGHHAVKDYFVDFAPKGMEIQEFPDEHTLPDGTKVHTMSSRMFVPSLVYDNKILLQNDPGYIARLKELGSPELVRAWLEGDWNVITGAYFPEFKSAKHIIRPFPIPDHWLRFRSADWGSASPFAVLWHAVSDGYQVPDGPYLPSGAVITYREWYGVMPGKINVGLRWPASRVGAGIKERDAREKITYGVIDPSAYKQDGGPSHAERMAGAGAFFKKADNNRIGGWDMVRERLCGIDDRLGIGANGEPPLDDLDDLGYVGTPMWYVFATCVHLIRTLPALQHDLNNPEDCDTTGEDHAPDALRYGLMSRPWKRPKPQGIVDKFHAAFAAVPTLDDLWAEHENAQGHFRQV